MSSKYYNEIRRFSGTCAVLRLDKLDEHEFGCTFSGADDRSISLGGERYGDGMSITLTYPGLGEAIDLSFLLEIFHEVTGTKSFEPPTLTNMLQFLEEHYYGWLSKPDAFLQIYCERYLRVP